MQAEPITRGAKTAAGGAKEAPQRFCCVTSRSWESHQDSASHLDRGATPDLATSETITGRAVRASERGFEGNGKKRSHPTLHQSMCISSASEEKKDGSLHFCVDYRKLNAITRKDAYTIPWIDESLDTLSGSYLFTTLDLLSGYWQVEVHPDGKSKTAVCTPEGLFEFNVMPFGLCNALATFQRLMDCVLTGLHWESYLVYVDDVIVLGKSFPDHLKNLQRVLQRLQEPGLKLKPSKCTLCQENVSYLGHVESQNGVFTDPAKIEAVMKWPTPTNGREVQQFPWTVQLLQTIYQEFRHPC